MAFYISPDGRVISFDAEVKADGSVRPRNYHDFIEGNLTPQQEPLTSEVKTRHNRTKAKRAPKKQPVQSNPVSLSSEPKGIKKACLEKIACIIDCSGLSASAKIFVRLRTAPLSIIPFTTKLYNKITKAGLDKEKNNILTVFNEINELIQSNCSSLMQLRGTQVVSTNQTIKQSAVQSSSYKLPSQTSRISYAKEEDPKHQASVDNTIYVRKGNVPKYGYARDYFGRVQERDSYREDRAVNPYSSLSSYDIEDDNESLDIL